MLDPSPTPLLPTLDAACAAMLGACAAAYASSLASVAASSTPSVRLKTGEEREGDVRKQTATSLARLSRVLSLSTDVLPRLQVVVIGRQVKVAVAA